MTNRKPLPWQRALLLAGSLLCATATHADAVWNTGPGHNGHAYRVVSVAGGITWDAADIAALALGGALATITSADENDFVFAEAALHPSAWFTDTAGHARGPWLGGFQPPGSPEPAGGWQWVNGEGAVVYTDWAPGQPNNTAGIESRLQFYGATAAFDRVWNDASDTAVMLGYVVEFSAPVPEPSPAALLLAGLLSAALIHHRRQGAQA